jgi:hypothetical protein
MEYLLQMELRMHAANVRVDVSIERKCKEHCDKLRRELGLGQCSRKMFRTMALVIMFCWSTILVVVVVDLEVLS